MALTQVAVTDDGMQDAARRIKEALDAAPGGVLSGRSLYMQYGEAHEQLIRAAITHLQAQDVLSVRGDISKPLGVFRAALQKK